MPVPSGLIVAWPSTVASIPAGWTRYAGLNDRVPKPASASIETDGGADTHTHPTASHTHGDLHGHANSTSGAVSAAVNGITGGGGIDSVVSPHTHAMVWQNAVGLTTGSISGTSSSSASTGFARYSVIWIQSNGTTDIPTNAVAWSNQAVIPAGWAAHAASINHYLRGAAVGADGGTATAAALHSHTYAHVHAQAVASHTHVGVATAASQVAYDSAGVDVNTDTGNHLNVTSVATTHAGNTANNNATADNQTPDLAFHKLQHVQASGTTPTPIGIIALWNTAAAPIGWTDCDGTQGTPNLNGSGNYVKGANGVGEIGNTGGSNSHAHSGSHSHVNNTTGGHTGNTVPSSGQSGLRTTGGNPAAAAAHTHTSGSPGNRNGGTSTDAVTYSSASWEPANRNMLFVMSLGPSIPMGLPDDDDSVLYRAVQRLSRVGTKVRDLVCQSTDYPTLLPYSTFDLARTLQWRLGGKLETTLDLMWRMGGKVSFEEESFRWRVAPGPLRVRYALTGRTGPVAYNFRFERRTKQNLFLEDVSPAFLGCTIDGNNDRTVFRVATFNIDADAFDDLGNSVIIDPLADHIAVFMDLLVDGNYSEPIQLGLFALTVPRKIFAGQGQEAWEVGGHDNSIHLIESTTTASYTVLAGANFLTGTNAVKDILDSLGVLYNLPSTSLTLAADQTWPPGTPWSTIITWLTSGANMYQLAFNAKGVAITRTRVSMASRTPDVIYTGDDFVLIPITEESETTRLANQVVVVVNDPNRPPLSSVANNNDPDSPISIVNLGRTITKVITADSAADQATLDDIAADYLQVEAGLYRRATIVTSIDPLREPNEIYEVSAEEVYESERWWVRNWRMDLKIGSQMTHTVGKVERIA